MLRAARGHETESKRLEVGSELLKLCVSGGMKVWDRVAQLRAPSLRHSIPAPCHQMVAFH